jgi:hypothetical protein
VGALAVLYERVCAFYGAWFIKHVAQRSQYAVGHVVWVREEESK